MKPFTPQDTLLITYHDNMDDEIAQQVIKTSLVEAISLGNIAIRQDRDVKSFRVLDVLYNSKDN
jgi:hypothetical protein